MTALPLYFDYAATTPVDDRVIATMLECLGRQGHFGNPASGSHGYGDNARQAVERARQQVGELVGAPAESLVWTSGATESNNLALKGVAQASDEGRRHIVSSRLEHKAVLDSLLELQRQGFDITWLEPDAAGLIQPEAVSQALRADTLLVSLMMVNNELGTLTDVASIGQRVRAHGALMHVDAAQATGKLNIDLRHMPIDLMSFSAHKTYGPKGIGALYVGERARGALHAQIHGGGHEQGLRSGTLATHQIVGMGSAFALAGAEQAAETARLGALSMRLREGLLNLPGVHLNGCATHRIAHTLNLRIERPGFNAAQLSSRLAVSSTSACNSASTAPSHVLLALGLSPAQALSSLRISLGRFTRPEDIEQALEVLESAVKAPPALW
jgi:cysteine desulfurase